MYLQRAPAIGCWPGMANVVTHKKIRLGCDPSSSILLEGRPTAVGPPTTPLQMPR